MGVKKENAQLVCLVKWKNEYLDVIPAKIIHEKIPQMLIQYYESCVPFSEQPVSSFFFQNLIVENYFIQYSICLQGQCHWFRLRLQY